MRDLNTIEPFLKELGDVWVSNPDLRFGQLVYILANKIGRDTDIFVPEDDKWFEAIRKLKENNNYMEGKEIKDMSFEKTDLNNEFGRKLETDEDFKRYYKQFEKERKENYSNMIYIECSVDFILKYYNDKTMKLEYKMPSVDLWIEYDTRIASFTSFLILNKINCTWRYYLI